MAVAPGRLVLAEAGGFPVVEVSGYLDGETGLRLRETVEDLLLVGQVDCVIDLSACELVNSQGTVELLYLANRVRDDFDGRLVCVGGSQFVREILELVGVFLLAPAAADREAAIALLRAG